MQDTILIVSDKQKNVSSSAGHQMMNNHPMAAMRYANANNRLTLLLTLLSSGDINLFCELIEAEPHKGRNRKRRLTRHKFHCPGKCSHTPLRDLSLS